MSEVLGSNKSDTNFDKHFDYRSLVGMLLYLEKGTRPDLAYAVHQCARHSSQPKSKHAKAMKKIGQYLRETKTRGTIMKPDTTKHIEIYVDADFAGGWTRATSADPRLSLSRSGYTLMYAGCPVLWKSQLQTMVALSTAEAEYIALSTALRQCIPVLRLANEIRKNMPGMEKLGTSVKCKVYEDNESTIRIAQSPKTTHQNKHISTKVHHFREYIRTKAIRIEHVHTTKQIADIFTKPLPVKAFISLRQKLMGW